MTQLKIKIDETETKIELFERELTKMDRCDSCGAEGFYRVLMKNGELIFCAHHATRYENTLKEQALLIQDEHGRLL